jgi:hypothetical protein
MTDYCLSHTKHHIFLLGTSGALNVGSHTPYVPWSLPNIFRLFVYKKLSWM